MGMEESTEDLCACMRGIGDQEPLQDLKQGSNMSYDLLFKKDHSRIGSILEEVERRG